ncbi:MAG: hypothetical protein FJ319_12800 [SAR202 cluster bacterium]|nr:hypothetical protein [SAR202 cluster bacterium]
MLPEIRLERAEFALVQFNDIKSWSFVEITDSEGASAAVEFQNARGPGNRDKLVVEALEKVRGRPITSERDIEGLLGLTDAELRASSDLASPIGVLRNAIVDLQAQHRGVTMTEALGGQPKERQLLYGNINRYLRATRGRTPADFGKAAELAVERGFTIIKSDPFGGVKGKGTVAEAKATWGESLARVQAMRTAVGPMVALQVDCHGAFNQETAPAIAEELHRLGVTWFEDPIISETRGGDFHGLRDKIEMALVAGGSDYGEAYFADLITHARVDIIMQDILRCGGVGVAARAGLEASKRGVKTSCHCPWGPPALLASAHVHTAVPDSFALEHAILEAPYRAEMIEPHERVEGGYLYFPGGPGLGARLNWKMVEKHGRRWKG